MTWNVTREAARRFNESERTERFLVIIICLLGAVLIFEHYSLDNLQTNLGRVAGFISSIAFFPYITSIVRGKTKPNRVTWFVWSVLGGLVFASYFSVGANNTLYIPAVYVLCPLFIVILSFRYRENKKNPLDFYCIIGAVVGIIAWQITSSPVLALSIFLLTDFVATLPTVWKSYERPQSEDFFAWTITLMGNVINLLAIEEWSFSIAIYPIYQCVIYVIIWFFLIRRKIL